MNSLEKQALRMHDYISKGDSGQVGSVDVQSSSVRGV